MEKNEEQKVWVNLSETISTGNYENVKIEVGYSKNYSGKDDPVQLVNDGVKELQAILKKKAKKIRKNVKLRKL